MAAYTAAASGGWVSKTTWGVTGASTNSPGGNTNDTATINAAVTVTYNNTQATIASLTVGGGSLVFNDPNNATSTILNVTGTTALSNGSIILNSNAAGSGVVTLCSANLSISGGTLTLNAANATLLVGNATGATITAGNFNISAGTFTDSGILTVNGTGVYNQSGGAASVTGAASLSGTETVSAGTLNIANAGSLTVSANTLTVNGTGAVNVNATTTVSGGNFNDACPMRAWLYITTGTTYATGVSAPVNLTRGVTDWETITFDLDNVNALSGVPDPTQINQLGIQISTETCP